MNFAEVRLVKTSQGTAVYLRIINVWRYKLFPDHFQPGQILNLIEGGTEYVNGWVTKAPA